MLPLEGTRVLDLSRGVAGPLCAMLLADHGADVVKVEPPGGAPDRAHPGNAVWNRGKRSLLLDTASPADAAVLDKLMATADICVVSAGRTQLSSTVLDPDTAAAAHPRLVYVHTPPYTDDARWVGGEESDALLAAALGPAWRQFSDGGGPVDDIYAHLTTVQGMWAATAAVAALVERRRSGRGQVVTVAGVHGTMVAAAGALTFQAADAREERRSAGGACGPVPYYRLYRCADEKWLFLAALIPRFTERAFRALGVEHLLSDPRLGPRPRAAMLTPEHAGWVIDELAARFATRTRAEWMDAFAAAGCPVGAVLDRDDWLDHPQLIATGMRAEVEDAERGNVVMPGVPVRLTATPGRVGGPAPEPGTTGAAALLVEWERADTPSAGVDAAVEAAGGPLQGVVVVDLGAIIAGPFAGSLLAELGATVVKVEPPGGDSFRGPGFAAYNKGQRSLAVDLADERGRDALLRVVEGADVVIDNYRPGVLERLGIGYESLRSVRPGIITVTVTGFGPGGPLGEEAGFDPVLQAMSGMMAAQGGDGHPVFFSIPVNDVAAATLAALAACLAVLHRSSTGQGQSAWTSLAAASTVMQAAELVRWAGKPDMRRGGPDHRGPDDHDRFIPVSGGWVRVQDRARVLTEGELAGLAGMTPDAAVRSLDERGVAAVAARLPGHLADDRDLVEYGVIEPDPRPGRDGWWTAGCPVRMSRTNRAGSLVAPGLGEHSVAVLLEAGLSGDQVQQLVDAGVVVDGRVVDGRVVDRAGG